MRKTTNYNLSQYDATDRVTRAAFNADNAAVDMALKAIATAAANAGSAASAAQTTANSASSAAATAQSTANTAKSSAATAQSTANTAKTNAATAQSTANTAKTNAATAQSTAESAKTTADSALALAQGKSDLFYTTGSHRGTGKGQWKLTLPGKPLLVLIRCNSPDSYNTLLIAFRDCDSAMYLFRDGLYYSRCYWEDDGVTFHWCNADGISENTMNLYYTYAALCTKA